MPFDNPYTPASEAARWWDREHQYPDPSPVLPKSDRWNSHLRGTPGITRQVLPLSDTMVLLALRDILRHQPGRWARGTIGNCNAACAVGWMAALTEPTNRPEKWTEQSRRIIGRLYRALPRSLQKRGSTCEQIIADYNDTRTNATLDRWLTRAIENA